MKFCGNMLTIRRESMGFTMAALAGRLKLSRQAVFKWERGITMPSPPNIVKISRVLKIKPQHLVMPEVSHGKKAA